MNKGSVFAGTALGLLFGGAIGFFVGSKIAEKKVRKICDEEIQSVKDTYKEYYDNKLHEAIDNLKYPDSLTQDDEDKNRFKKYAPPPAEEIDNSGEVRVILDANMNKPPISTYFDYAKKSMEEHSALEKPIPVDEKGLIDIVDPQIVTDNDEEWRVVDLTLYSDNVLCDDLDVPLSDDEIIGALGSLNALDHMGEIEKGALYVRNEKRQCYYEVFLDLRTYKDVVEGITDNYPNPDDE